MKKLISLALVLVMLCTVSLAFAKSLAPDNSEVEYLEGAVIHATVGAYNETTKTLTVTLYKNDNFDLEDVDKLAAGDLLLANDQGCKVREKKNDADGNILVTTEDGMELIFFQIGGDDVNLKLAEDDRQCMHAYAVLNLPVAEGIVYEDNSDPEANAPVVTKGLEEILKIKEQKEKDSIGFDFYATTIELNQNLEIVRIHQEFDVAQ